MAKANIEKTRWQKILHFIEYGMVPLWLKNCMFVALVTLFYTVHIYLKNPS